MIKASAKLPWKIDLSADFTWQTGQPLTPVIITSGGNAIEPLSRNSIRLPSARQLNFGLKRAWATADGKLRIGSELQVFNVLNELNVFGGLGRFDTPAGVGRPTDYPPLRPIVVPTGIDVSRSLQLGP